MDNGRGRRTSLRIRMVADRRLWASSLISHVSLSLVHPQCITPVAHQSLFRRHILLQPLVWLKWSSSPSLSPKPEAPLIPPQRRKTDTLRRKVFFPPEEPRYSKVHSFPLRSVWEFSVRPMVHSRTAIAFWSADLCDVLVSPFDFPES